MSRLTSDVETIEILVTESLVQMAGTAVLLVGSIAVLFTLDLTLAFISLLAVGPPLVVATMRFRTRSERAYGRVRERVASVLSMMQETVRGVQVIQAFGRERFNASKFRDENGEWREANVESFRLGSLFFPAMELVGLFGTIVVLAYGGWRALQGDLSIGVLSAFVLYLTATLEPVQQLSQLYDVFQSAMAGLAKIAQLLDERPKIIDSPEAVLVPTSNGQADVDEVNFRYAKNLPYALQDVDLQIAPGEMIALVGPTGAGKSTIAKLLLRFYDPSDGTVKLDGRSLTEVRLESLRKHASVVPQEGFLFRGTIRDNVRFGRPEATDEEVEQICRVLGIDEVIRSLPGGYEAEVRERGSALSSGERQMIALARA
ncbi:MAG: ABC transporter ATP-binding protein, partial [Acidimicrobiia bacterium]